MPPAPHSFWTTMDDLVQRRSVLAHPFYVRWSRGELSGDELALYAGQYRHAVVALAQASAHAAQAADGALRRRLEAHADEEAAHVALWDGFADAVGSPPDQPALPETARCARAWAGEGRGLAGGLAALYAIESGQPAISATKLRGLVDHYGVSPGPATAYFDVHHGRDVEHAREGRAALDAVGVRREDRLLAEAEAVLEANWQLLDGVEREARRQGLMDS